jgi:hypothetical protein
MEVSSEVIVSKRSTLVFIIAAFRTTPGKASIIIKASFNTVSDMLGEFSLSPKEGHHATKFDGNSPG